MLSLFLCLSPQSPTNPFQIQTSHGTITSIRYANDKLATEYIATKKKLGAVQVHYRIKQGAWQPADKNLGVNSTFETKNGKLIWHFKITNQSTKPLELGGVATPLPMNTRFENGHKSSVLKHSFISGAGSFAFWMRPDSKGPYLTMTCLPGTSLEYWNHTQDGTYQTFVHSASEIPTIQSKNGSWRLPHTSKTLLPGQSVDYGYAFEWAKDYPSVRDILARNGKLDVQIAPGMTVPTDLTTEVALRSSAPISSIKPEYPAQTKIQYITTRGNYKIYRVQFKKLGENLLTVNQGKSKTYLEFFSCEPVETLIKKRAAFLTKSQELNPEKWYQGLLREWNMKSKVSLSPDNYDLIKGWRIYEVTCDDPGLGKPGYLASKNAEFPVQKEVDALDRYITHFVWGGLQHTTEEPFPYAIYGIPDWKTLRASKATDKTKGTEHLWRCYDYPHIVLMYRSMYQVAKNNPSIKTQLPAREYLQRAYGTTVAMFTVPDKLVKWSPYETGYYNEVVIPELIKDLEQEHMTDEAAKLREFWTKKVQAFVGGDLDLFSSEYAFDSTGFESTEALGDYVIKNNQQPTKARAFLDKQMAANLFCRGTIEPAYYYLGSDYRGGGGDGYTLSYMAQMGGGSVLHYGLNYAPDPSPYLRLGYQSILSSWALMNSGTATSNYGYWYPGKDNDGAAGGGFEPAAYGHTWLDQPHGRGSWYYSCEIDLGFSGALRAARTVVADDPIFGRFCFGGSTVPSKQGYSFVPKDGLRRRLSIRTSHTSLDLELHGTRFSGPITLDEKRHELTFTTEASDRPNLSFALSGKSRPTMKLPLPSKVGPNHRFVVRFEPTH